MMPTSKAGEYDPPPGAPPAYYPQGTPPVGPSYYPQPQGAPPGAHQPPPQQGVPLGYPTNPVAAAPTYMHPMQPQVMQPVAMQPQVMVAQPMQPVYIAQTQLVPQAYCGACWHASAKLLWVLSLVGSSIYPELPKIPIAAEMCHTSIQIVSNDSQSLHSHTRPSANTQQSKRVGLPSSSQANRKDPSTTADKISPFYIDGLDLTALRRKPNPGTPPI
eukprot:16582-Prorocentrum_minimum.AAC.1